MFKKNVVTMVGNEVAYQNIISIDESNVDAIEKLIAVFSSNPTVMLTDDFDAVEGSVWDGKKFIPPAK